MKTISKLQLEKDLTFLTVKSEINPFPISKKSIAYKKVVEVLNGAKEIRPVKVMGSGRYVSYKDDTFTISSVLGKLGIIFNITNDAPRGGLSGNLITILTEIK